MYVKGKRHLLQGWYTGSSPVMSRGGIEPPTQGFSVLCSTTELSGRIKEKRKDKNNNEKK